MKTTFKQRLIDIVAACAISAGYLAATFQISPSAAAQSSGASDQTGFVMRVNAELVLTNVVARDAKTGEVVRGLKQSDFTLYENGKPQQITTFDFQSVDMATPLSEATVSGLAESASGSKAAVVALPEDLRNHR